MSNESPASVLVSSTGNEVNIASDGSSYRIYTQDKFVNDRDLIVGADFYKTDGSGSPDYYIGIDLDNQSGAGPYKHSNNTNIVLVSAHGILLKSSIGSSWDSLIGVILSYSNPNANIAWLQDGVIYARDTSSVYERTDVHTFPTKLDLTVSAGDLTKIPAGYKQTSVNIGATLSDIAGNSITPAVGDLIVKVDNVSGSGTADIHYSFLYYVE